jgi:capsular exopolysaccharide synthesis family protein
VTHVPAPLEPRPHLELPVRLTRPDPGDTPELPIAQIWGIFRRHWLQIGLCGALALAAAIAYAMSVTPIYRGAATLRIDDKTGKLPDVLQPFGSGGEVLTELEVLKSRSLVEDAARELGLQLVIVKPEGLSRDTYLSNVTVADSAGPEVYRFHRGADGTFVVTDTSGVILRRNIAPGNAVQLGDAHFVLTPATRRLARFEVVVEPLEFTVVRLRSGISVVQPNREAKVAALSYQSTDRELSWKLPNTIADRFIVRRQGIQKATARSTVAFLRVQLDTLHRQLNASELALREFREREHVVNPTVEGTSQVERLVKLQSERSGVEAERAALAQLLAQVQRSAESSGGHSTSYRQLLAFPTLLRNQAASELLGSLAEVENQRSQLLVRRTPDDPEVQALEARDREIQQQLRAVASTYLAGLTNTVASLETAIAGFGNQLARVPRRELEFARLQRQPKVLEEMYALLQTRLKEAEIAQAVDDPSVQIVDRAVRPLLPVSPRKRLLAMAGLMAGLMAGAAIAFLREYLDKSVHTRGDVTDATGLPVLGLIPRIPKGGKRVALITQRKGVQADAAAAPPPPKPRAGPMPPQPAKRLYTFLGQEPEAREPEQLPMEVRSLPSAAAPLPARVQRMAVTGIGTALAEAYGSLQTNLMHSRVDQPVQAVVFTSAQPGEGKTTSVVNLALSLTHRGTKVLLIDADLRRGTVHSVFEVGREPGLADVVRGAVPFEQARREIRVDDGGTLHYLTSGRLPGNPSAMLASRELRDLLLGLRSEYDTIILDSPPVNMMTDAALLAAATDGVVIVARAGVTHSAALSYAMEQLSHVRALVLGVVLNDIDFRRDVSYDAAYRYYDYGQYTAAGASS